MFDYDSIPLDDMLARAYNSMSEHQRNAVGKGRNHGRVLFNMWMGVGKTFPAITLGLCFKPQVWVVIGSKNALPGWKKEIEKWFPEIDTSKYFQIVRGTPLERQKIWGTPSLIYATTAASFVRDIEWLRTKKVKVDVISIDEPHKFGFRNRKAQIVAAMKDLIKVVEKYQPKVKLINFLTGTWTSKGAPQQFPILNILAPKEFKSYWQHVHTYSIVIKGPFGTEIGGAKNTEGLAIVTSPYVYTVTEEMAKKELPPIQRMRIEAELPPDLITPYYTLLRELYFEHDNKVTSVSTILASYIKLRQMICCPKIVLPNYSGAGPSIEACVDKMRENDEIANWRHNLVFTPFIPSIPIFRDYLSDELKLPQGKIITLQGGMEAEELAEAEVRFRRDPETLIIASVKFGQSWNAETALNCFFPQFEWDQDENKQCEGRSRRKDGQQLHIGSYYVNFAGTISEDMLEILNRKEHLNNVTYQSFEKVRLKIKAQLEARKLL